ncbi:MAG: TetR/AcrR family transcriptional regulator [Campylobacterales bacterium]|nr:TetR/AcrR family transcriptional regulator [Campylobacterales bacterium]
MNQKNKKSEIINSTIRVIAKHGFAASPVSLIAKEADISVGLIYKYFPSKESLIFGIYKEILSDIDLILDQKYSKNKPLKRQLKRRWIGIFNYLCDNPSKAKFLQEFDSSVYISTIKNDICDFCSFTDLIEKSSVKSQLKDLDGKLILNFFKSTILTGFTQVQMEEQLDRKTIENGMFSMFWDGVRLESS